MKSDISQCSQELEDSNLDLKEPIILNHFPRLSKTGKGGTGLLTSKEHCYALDRSPHFVALGNQKSTNTQVNSSKTNSQESKTMETQQKLNQANYQTLICSVEDFLAKHSVSLESGKDLKTLEVQCF